jgi:putative phage-type endonuclease
MLKFRLSKEKDAKKRRSPMTTAIKVNPITERSEWLRQRRSGIGGSDIAAIMGLSPWKTSYQLWLEKTGQAPDTEETPAMYWGTVLEDVVAKEYAVRTADKVQRVNQILRHPELEFMIANIDRAVINPEISGNVRWTGQGLTTDKILECKTANGFAASKWGEPGSDFVPEQYIMQCQWYMGVTNTEYCDLAVLIGGNDFRVYHLQRDKELIDMMIAAAGEFWGYVLRNEPPPPTTTAECAELYSKADKGSVAYIDEDGMSAAIEILQIADRMKELKAREDELKATIQSQMANSEVAEHMGTQIATWKNQISNRLDTKQLKKDMPDIVKQYTTESESRVFRLKIKGA